MRGLLLLAASLSRKNCWTRPIWEEMLSTVMGGRGGGGGRAEGREEERLLFLFVSRALEGGDGGYIVEK